MAKEVVTSRPQEHKETDPYFREHEHGSYLIDQVQVQLVERVSKNKRIPPKKVPYLAQGFVYYHDTLVGFKAFNATYDVTLAMGNNWSPHAPLDPGKMDQLVGHPHFGEENFQRLQEVYPQAFPLEDVDYQSLHEAFVNRSDVSDKKAFADLVDHAIRDALAHKATGK